MPHTLLLADDSVTIQRVIELTFADEDIRVVAVSDGDQAIAALDRTPPDIVLADVGMPGRDGYQVAEHIKRSPQLAHIPVLLLTGAFEPVDQARAAQAGCDGVLAKPFEPQQVIGRVKELLAKAKELPAALDGPFSPAPASVPVAAWPAAVDDPAPAPAPTSEAARDSREDVDHYFDRLDRAFASLSGGKEPQSAEPSVADRIDWFSKSLAPGDSDPTDGGQPPAGFGAAADAVAAPSPTADASAGAPDVAGGDNTSGSARHAGMPSLADAFSALLAAEQAMPAPPAAAWRSMHADAETPPAAVELSDASLDDIVRRVLERLSDRAVRDTVAGLVSDVAERLVKEEIERIKGAAH